MRIPVPCMALSTAVGHLENNVMLDADEAASTLAGPVVPPEAVVIVWHTLPDGQQTQLGEEHVDPLSLNDV